MTNCNNELYIYGKLNQELEKNEYKAKQITEDDTAKVSVDNINNTISAEVIKTPGVLTITQTQNNVLGSFQGKDNVNIDLSISNLNNNITSKEDRFASESYVESKIPSFTAEDAGKSLVVNQTGDNLEWKTVGGSSETKKYQHCIHVYGGIEDSTISNYYKISFVINVISSEENEFDFTSDLYDILGGHAAIGKWYECSGNIVCPYYNGDSDKTHIINITYVKQGDKSGSGSDTEHHLFFGGTSYILDSSTGLVSDFKLWDDNDMPMEYEMILFGMDPYPTIEDSVTSL